MDIWKNFVNLFQDNGGDKQVLWQEMSYQTYVQNSDETEPEVWDKENEPSIEDWAVWLNEFI